ncbi:hypothetical protein HMPREF0201_04519 [Cedecea davisae DSM 4568]|uniref:Uncharacterized protein n=1 Tax=Cedecea davisae DSM 4568 TaxID=566551 RepID=S3IKI3_9ENTR|nr:hypothetical protein HMPREF0201_04519 [Cedecea davisae DSM 4568]
MSNFILKSRQLWLNKNHESDHESRRPTRRLSGWLLILSFRPDYKNKATSYSTKLLHED